MSWLFCSSRNSNSLSQECNYSTFKPFTHAYVHQIPYVIYLCICTCWKHFIILKERGKMGACKKEKEENSSLLLDKQFLQWEKDKNYLKISHLNISSPNSDYDLVKDVLLFISNRWKSRSLHLLSRFSNPCSLKVNKPWIQTLLSVSLRILPEIQLHIQIACFVEKIMLARYRRTRWVVQHSYPVWPGSPECCRS